MVPIELGGVGALVTGAGRGIGAEIARMLAAAGARVTVSDVDGAAAEQVAHDLGSDHRAIVLDVTDDASVEAAARDAEPAILVNNAFFAVPGPFVPGDAENDARTIEVILGGTIRVSRAVLPAMIARGHGRIVNVASEAGRTGEAGMVAYSAAKAGVIGVTRALARELGPFGVNVNAVSPAATLTETTLDQLTAMGVEPDALARQYPLRRLGQPGDIASAVLWLASPLASWVTGQVLGVNGGFVTS